MDTQLVPMHKTLSQEYFRVAIGCDALAVLRTDDAGYRYIIVMVNLFSKYVTLYPVKSHDAILLATTLFQTLDKAVEQSHGLATYSIYA